MAASDSVIRLVSDAENSAYAAAGAAAGLSGGGGGSTYDNMEHRIAALEARASKSEDVLERISGTLADIRVDLAAKPTTSGLWGMVATVVGVGIAIAFGTFAVAEYSSTRNGGAAQEPHTTILVVPQIPAQPTMALPAR